MYSSRSLTYLSQTDINQSVLVLNVDGSDAPAPVSFFFWEICATWIYSWWEWCLMFMGPVLSLKRSLLSFFERYLQLAFIPAVCMYVEAAHLGLFVHACSWYKAKKCDSPVAGIFERWVGVGVGWCTLNLVRSDKHYPPQWGRCTLTCSHLFFMTLPHSVQACLYLFLYETVAH